MNYTKHYNMLIERAKNRKLTGYVEKHHITPKCLGGDDNKENLVELTPEEHYVAHQLLLNMYPNKPGLIYAAMMMTIKNDNQTRNNKLYGWLRRKHADAMSVNKKGKHTGKQNSQYGTCWVSNLETMECKKIKVDELDTYLSSGWIKKRIIKWDKKDKIKLCLHCGSTFIQRKKTNVYCSKKCVNSEKKNKEKEWVTKKLIEFIQGEFVSLNKYAKQTGIKQQTLSHAIRTHYPQLTLSKCDLEQNRRNIIELLMNI